MLCLTLTGQTMEENMEILARNRSFVSMAELRLDLLDCEDPKQMSLIKSFEHDSGIPVILTCRRKTDGGLFDGSERKRNSILRKALEGGFSYIDLELDTKKAELEEYAKARGTRIIRSFHDFSGIPENTFSTISKIQAKGEIPKAAVMINGIQDLITLYKVREASSGKEMIIVGMGQYGVPSRILYRKFGSMLMFCSEKDTGNTGILTPSAMKQLYHADSIDFRTTVFGLVGNPVSHSMSPAIHNSGFEKIKFNAVYVPFLVDNVRSFFHFAEKLQIGGFSVTIPHKIAILPYLGRSSREVKQIGSCNTVVREGACWKGSNTDYYGFLSLVENDIANGKIQSAIIIGAGGAARAIAYALRNRKVNVLILNRTLEKAKALAESTMSSYDSLENASLYSGKADIIVQATSVGMNDEDADAAPNLKLTGHETVCDLVYSPAETAIIRRAQASGCRIIHGMDLLLAQGYLQFESFTGFKYP